MAYKLNHTRYWLRIWNSNFSCLFRTCNEGSFWKRACSSHNKVFTDHDTKDRWYAWKKNCEFTGKSSQCCWCRHETEQLKKRLQPMVIWKIMFHQLLSVLEIASSYFDQQENSKIQVRSTEWRYTRQWRYGVTQSSSRDFAHQCSKFLCKYVICCCGTSITKHISVSSKRNIWPFWW